MWFHKRGYKVRLRGATAVEYQKNGRRLVLGVEFLVGDEGIVIYGRKPLRWEPPHDGEAITEAEALQIKEDVLADLVRNKIVADWVD